ncbi:hypothetical protein QE152_g3888 [Popillia japonica]|uniref:Uncharacterized protein n=1 Tax=Popillia japonica TaxID=7064 RepID=A0AAW1N2G1_POPJA
MKITANILLNDPVQAENYLERLFNSNQSENQNENKESLNMLWSSKDKPSIKDTEATDFFLMLRQKYASQFDDKKNLKRGKDKVNPRNLQDSFEAESLATDITSDSEISEIEPSTSRETKPKNRF